MISSTNSPRQLVWDIGSDKCPKNENNFLEGIQFLDGHPEWIQRHPDEAIQSFKLLEITTYRNCSPAVVKEAKKIHDSLCKKYPKLFPSIKIKMGDSESEMPIHDLKRFEKFRVLLSHKTIETEEQITIDLTNPEFTEEKDIFENFLEYLKSGTVSMTGENVTPLLQLANMNLLPELQQDCLTFLEENLTEENLGDILNFAVQSKTHDLMWVCMKFVYTNPEKKAIKDLLDQENTSDEAKFFIEAAFKCYELKVIPKFDRGQRCIKLSDAYNFKSQESQAFLEELNKWGLLRGLIIGSVPRDEDLKTLAKSIPILYRLDIRNDKIKELPQEWLDQVKDLDCNDCTSLTTLNAQAAIKLICRHCTSLTTLNAQSAETLYCYDCTSLTTLNAQVAIELNCKGCTSLTTLNAQSAEKLICIGCTRLKTINAQAVKFLNCSHCSSLKQMTLKKGCDILGKKLGGNCQITYTE